MKLIFFIVTSLIFTVSCGEKVTSNKPLVKENSEVNKPVKVTNCVCTMMYAPVCGKDGKTYSNPCVAGCNKTEYTEGACK